jgi:hypothetical protein
VEADTAEHARIGLAAAEDHRRHAGDRMHGEIEKLHD